MLYALDIRNFVLVENLELQLGDGLTVITGETGAGKSILIDALGLLLGERADSGVVRTDCEESEISGAFDLTPELRAWLESNDLTSGEDCIVRRVISRGGRSRAYLNDHPVTVQSLREAAEFLVDVHSQHAHQSLLKAETQRALLDSMAGHAELQGKVRERYQAWRDLRNSLKELGGNAADRTAQIHLLRYQVEELENLEVGNAQSLQDLQEEHRRLAHAGQLLENAQQALESLDGDNGGAALAGLYHAQRALQNVLAHDSQLQPLLDMLDGAAIQAQEAGDELRHYLNRLESDPQRLSWLDQRIGDLQDLARKHQIAVAELPAKLDDLKTKLDGLEHYEERAAQLEAELAKALEQYRAAALELSQQRAATALVLGKRITANIHQLGMGKGRFEIRVEHQADAKPAALGTDQVEFLVSANPGQPLKPLHKAASGGELSRISLAVQVITAEGSGVPTLVFDEVDVGVGGGVAEIIGKQLQALGGKCQVLCITHLPQVAAYGKRHLQVRKTSRKNSTQTHLTPLEAEQRVEELARMLGGLEITAQTLAHAREMLERGGA